MNMNKDTNLNNSSSSVFDIQNDINYTESPPQKIEEKKLKLSYDSNNINHNTTNNNHSTCTSNHNIKPKISKVNISNNSSNKIGKELHSMYNISKGGHQLINNNHPCKTQSNSKSKSKSTSRECSSNPTHYQYQLISGNPNNNKVVKVKHSLINKSQPLLNGKLFSKINMKPYPKPKFPSSKMQYAQSTQSNSTTIGNNNNTNNKKSINNINIILGNSNKNKSHSHLTHNQGLYQSTPSTNINNTNSNNNNNSNNAYNYSNPTTNVNTHPNLTIPNNNTNINSNHNSNTTQPKLVMSYISHNYQNAHPHAHNSHIKSKPNTNINFQKKPLVSICQASIPVQITQNKTLSSETRKNTCGDNNDNPPIANSHRNNPPIGLNNMTDSDYIELNTQNNNNNNHNNRSNKEVPSTIKNEELMKEVKNTLEENLKVMLNFSYENFLSKESESESKNTSLHEMNSNEYNDHHHYYQPPLHPKTNHN